MSNFIYLDIETVPLSKSKRLFAKPNKDTFNYGKATKQETKDRIFKDAVSAWETGKDAALKAETGMVALIGYSNDGETFNYLAADKLNEEKRILLKFWSMFEKGPISTPKTIVGHYVATYDMPFLVRRSFIRDISVPSWIIGDLNKYRSEIIRDIRLMWTFGNKNEHISLERICAAFGIKVKTGEVNGANFYKYWQSGNGDDKLKAIAYCKEDVMALPALYQRLR